LRRDFVGFDLMKKTTINQNHRLAKYRVTADELARAGIEMPEPEPRNVSRECLDLWRGRRDMVVRLLQKGHPQAVVARMMGVNGQTTNKIANRVGGLVFLTCDELAELNAVRVKLKKPRLVYRGQAKEWEETK